MKTLVLEVTTSDRLAKQLLYEELTFDPAAFGEATQSVLKRVLDVVYNLPDNAELTITSCTTRWAGRPLTAKD